MPFTPAHSAVVLPFIRSRHLSATGLILGSMSPDFEYFFKFSVSSDHSHTIAGLLYFDLPVTFLLAWIFHRFVKTNLIHNLPVNLQRKFQGLLNTSVEEVLLKRPATFALSALAGAATHLLWDAFTHNNTFISRSFDIYRTVKIPYEGVNYPLFYALQQLSTGVGLLWVLIYILLITPETPTVLKKPSVLYWIALSGITALIVVLRFYIHSSDYELGNLIVTIISGLCIALLICGLIPFRNNNLRYRFSNG